MKSFKKYLFGCAATAALTAGLSLPAVAAPTPLFTVTPTGLPGVPANNVCTPVPCGTAPFQADEISGNSSDLITFTSTTTASFTGYIQVTNFVNSFTSTTTTGGVGTFYNLIISFTGTDHLISIDPTTGLETFALDTLSYSLFDDPSKNDVLSPPNAAANTGGTFTDPAPGDDILLMSGVLVTGPQSDATINPNTSAAALNSEETSVLTAAGSLYFTQPVPFFNLAFTEFNNTGPNVTIANGGPGGAETIAITSATGQIDFNIPEPGSLALLGSGLLCLGLVFTLRGKKT